MHASLPMALSLTLALATGAVAARDHTLLIVDSRGQPADELVEEARRLAQHRRARVKVRWIRLGAPWDLSPPSAAPPGPEAEHQEPPPEPEWDPDGSEVAEYELEGMPRILVLDPKGHVLWRGAFLDTPGLRYLGRHPDRPLPGSTAP